MCRIERYCCCFTLRGGVRALSFATVFSHALALFWGVYFVLDKYVDNPESEEEKGEPEAESEVETEDEEDYEWIYYLVGSVLPNLIGLACGCFLLMGIIKENRWFFVPWLTLVAFEILSLSLTTIYMLYMHVHVFEGSEEEETLIFIRTNCAECSSPWPVFLFLGMIVASMIYIWIGVKSLFVEMGKEAIENEDETLVTVWTQQSDPPPTYGGLSPAYSNARQFSVETQESTELPGYTSYSTQNSQPYGYPRHQDTPMTEDGQGSMATDDERTETD